MKPLPTSVRIFRENAAGGLANKRYLQLNMSAAELASSYAALILADDGIEITVRLHQTSEDLSLVEMLDLVGDGREEFSVEEGRDWGGIGEGCGGGEGIPTDQHSRQRREMDI